ncbi:MAG: winged helix-turn-helix transcriptional regulator [Promethearchaeota archaeon]
MNQRTTFENTSCSIAQTLNIIGEWWTPLILRDIFYGIRRFTLLRDHLGISKKVLTSRLNTLVKNEIITRSKYQDRPSRYEYVFTNAGKELFPIIVAIMGWGNKWIYDDEDIPIQLVDDHNRKVVPVLINEITKEPIVFGKIVIKQGSPKHKVEFESMVEFRDKGRTDDF